MGVEADSVGLYEHGSGTHSITLATKDLKKNGSAAHVRYDQYKHSETIAEARAPGASSQDF